MTTTKNTTATTRSKIMAAGRQCKSISIYRAEQAANVGRKSQIKCLNKTQHSKRRRMARLVGWVAWVVCGAKNKMKTQNKTNQGEDEKEQAAYIYFSRRLYIGKTMIALNKIPKKRVVGGGGEATDVISKNEH